MTAHPREGLAAILARLTPGERVFLPGSAAEIPALTDALFRPDAVALDITASFVPGINPMPEGALPEGGRFANPFAMRPASPGFVQMPFSYGAYARALSRMAFDTCILHVAPPDRQGRASLGPAVEFAPIAMARSRRVIAVVNPMMPAIPGAARFDLSRAEAVVTLPAPLRVYEVGGASAEAQAIAAGIARFVEDGSTLQIGLGKVPDALLRGLTDRQDLRLHSGMLSDGMQALAATGALAPACPAVSCVHVGSLAHYDWLRDRPGIAVRPVTETHAPAVLAALPRLVAVNGALSVDLFGQANLEMLGPRAISGVGGAADFARAAALAPDGISVIGLPSTTPKGESRIVPALQGVVSLPRQDIDVVVTEHGAADLRGVGVAERAERLIAVAAPRHRPALSEALAGLLARL